MASTPFDITFLPERRSHRASGPTPLYLAAAGAGILLEQPCGSLGACGRCRVRLVDGHVAATDADVACLSGAELAAGWRLGCQLVLTGPAAIEVPPVVRSVAGKSFGPDLDPAGLARPVLDIVRVAVPSPGASSVSVLDDLCAALGRRPRSVRAHPRALADLSRHCRAGGELRAAIEAGELVAIRPGVAPPLLGLAVDIGTTSLAAALVRLDDGAVVASASRLNPQVAFGADVIARIQHAIGQPEGLVHLQAAVRDGLQALVDELTAVAGCHADDVVTATVAGNPTMIHAWAGVGIATLGVSPFTGSWTAEVACRAAEVGLGTNPNASVYVFPQIRSHVGADAVAAAVACGLDREDRCRLLVDLGTNSEVLVACGDRVVATSAAAGPAFEGVSIRHGMRASPGAIDVVAFAADGRVEMNTIGGAPPEGICGSGLIDLVAEMLRVGLVAPSGYLRRPDEVQGPALAFRSRLTTVDGQRAFIAAPAAEWGGQHDVLLTARDIREVQLAKGSILTAAALACRHLGLELGQLDEVLVAGAFGNFVRKSSAVRIGLMPAVDPERIHLVGNAAGMGARLALVDREVRQRARRLAGRAEYVDLAARPDYQAALMEAVAFPQ